MIHYIYTLKHPITNEVRYVGKTINVKRRLKQHLYDKRQTSYKASWIKSLKDLGLKPVLTIIEECTCDNWEDREKFWITQYDNLTNLKIGGNGGDDYKRKTSHESIEKIRKANLGKILSDDHKSKLRDASLKKEIIIDNIKYNSISEASRKLNIPYQTIHHRVNNIKVDNYSYYNL